MDNKACKLLGVVLKTNGFKGKLHIKLEGDIPNKDIELGPVFLELSSGLVPFFLMPNEGLSFKGNNTATLHLDGFDSDKKVKEFIGKKVFLPKGLFPENRQESYDSLIGYFVTDKQRGELGKVVDFIEISMNNVLVVKHTATKAEILIPATSEIVSDVDDTQKQITTDCPDGLIDLYLEA